MRSLAGHGQRCPDGSQPACEQPGWLMHPCPAKITNGAPGYRCNCCMPCEAACGGGVAAAGAPVPRETDPREDLVEAMKPVAAHLPAAVASRDTARLAELLGKAPAYEHLVALILILAEGADHARLRLVTGCPVPLSPADAHVMYERLASNSARIPPEVRLGEQQWRRQQQTASRRAS